MTKFLRIASLPAFALGVVAALASGCVAPGEPRPVEDGPMLEDRTEPVRVYSRVEQACWAVGMLDPQCDDPSQCEADWTCPADVGVGWTLAGDGAMFATGNEALQLEGITESELPLHLRRFCLYEGSAQQAFPPTAPNITASIDCPTVVGLGNALSDDLQAPTQAAFEAHAGGAPSTITMGTYGVHVGIVDTESSHGSTRASDHSPMMKSIVNELACDDGPNCGVTVRESLALPLDEAGVRRDPDGGIYGTRAHLALGIMEAVQKWKNEDPEVPLVLNLSLGWPATSNGELLSEDMPWPTDHVTVFEDTIEHPELGWKYPTQYAVAAVHAALLYASCHGALIVAASGNASCESCNDASVAPAEWAKYRAPTRSECASLGFDPPTEHEFRVPEDDESSWPLVTPVGALGYDNMPIGATRPSSRTVLMAAGFHATADEDFAPITGTSVSAATVSAAAALMLSQDSSLTPGALTQRMYTEGRSTGLVPQFKQWTVDDTLPIRSRQLMLCRAQLLGTRCSQTQFLARSAAAIDALNVATAVELAQLPPTVPSFSLDAALMDETMIEDECHACARDVTVFADPSPDPMLPHWFFNDCDVLTADFVFDTNPQIVGPQPNPPVCSQCPVRYTNASGNTTATISVDSNFRSYTWTGAMLEFVHVGGRKTDVDLTTLVTLEALQDNPTVTVNLGTRITNVDTVQFALTYRDGAEQPTTRNEVRYLRE
jgi:hypothetical protein